MSRVVVTLIALATFGPYLVGSIRTEQAVIYGLTLLLFPVFLGSFSLSGGMRFLLPWVAYTVIATLGVLFPSAAASPFPPGNLLAGYDSLLLPLALMLLIWSVVPPGRAEALLVRVCKIVGVAMAINGTLAIISTRIDISAILRPFWTNTDGVTTVAANAATMGRFSGIFNQPAEAGAMYAIAGIAVVYAWRDRAAFQTLLLTLITLGGLISVSKIFILGGLPVTIVYWLWSKRGAMRVPVLFGLGLLALGILQSGLLDQWTGADYLGRLFVSSDNGLLALYSAGRFQSQSAFEDTVHNALSTSPISGVGAAGWAVPYDGVLSESLVIGGILGLLCVVAVFIAMFTMVHKFHGTTRMFTFWLAVVTIGASLGFSPLTGNRTSTVCWMLIALLVLVARDQHANTPAATLNVPSLHTIPELPVARRGGQNALRPVHRSRP